MDDQGMHDSLVWQALAGLPVPVGQRARQQLTEYVARAKAMAAAQQRGVKVAPSDRRSMAERFDDEADRLDELGDPTVPVWRAFAESARLADQVRELDPDYTD